MDEDRPIERRDGPSPDAHARVDDPSASPDAHARVDDSSPRPDAHARDDDSSVSPRLIGDAHVARASAVFHVALLGVLFPIVSLPFVLGAAIWAWRRRAGAPRWAWRLAALAVVDLLVAAAFVGIWLQPSSRLAAAPARSPVIGVRIDDAPRGVAIEPVDGGPADLAGLRAGDVVLAVDDEPIGSAEDLQRAIGQGPLAPRRIHIERGGVALDVEVEPARSAASGGLRAGRRGLFVPEHEILEAEACFEPELPRPSATTIALLSMALALCLLLWRREARTERSDTSAPKGARFWLPFAGVFVLASVTAALARAGGCALFGGHAPGTFLLTLTLQGAVLALGGAWLARRGPRVGPLLPPLGHARTFAQSMLYALGWVPRAGILAFALHGLAERLGLSLLPMLLEVGSQTGFGQVGVQHMAFAQISFGQTGTALDAFVDTELGFAGGALDAFAHIGFGQTGAALDAFAGIGFGQTGTALDAFVDTELGFAGGALLLFAGALLGPLAEELLFRGALLPHLARTLSPWPAIVASGLLFGLLHVHHGPSIAGPLVLGVILGWARARTGSLLVPFLLHASLNAASLTMVVLLG